MSAGGCVDRAEALRPLEPATGPVDPDRSYRGRSTRAPKKSRPAHWRSAPTMSSGAKSPPCPLKKLSYASALAFSTPHAVR